MKQAKETTSHFIDCGKGILSSYEIENKTLLQKILSIGMKSCVDSYIKNKYERDKARTILEKGANASEIVNMRRYSNINLFNLNKCLAVVFFIVVLIDVLIVLYLNKLHLFQDIELRKNIAAIIIVDFAVVLTMAIPMAFGKLQSEFLLNEFRKIDEISRIEDLEELQNKMKILDEKERLGKDKLACNLYFK